MEASRGDRANVERLERDDILHRKNAALLSGGEIGALRRAWDEIKDLSETVRSDRRGFFELAGQHGVPYWRCPHHVPERLFLPWHRAYLYRLEQALQDRVPGVTLPWWDWTTTREVPGPFAAAEVDGGENSLFSTRTLVSEADRREGRAVVDETFRQPGSPDGLPIPEQLADALNQPNFVVFSDAVEELHDAVHGWTDGTMGDVAYAAFDPVFWPHHCMVDRIWWLWQQHNRLNAVPVARWEDIVLEPFNLTVRDTLNANALGYEYADSETALAWQAVDADAATRVVTRPVDVADVVRSPDFYRADLEVGGIRHTGSSYEARIYLNAPDADASTGVRVPEYIGSFHVFGHGGCYGAEGHCHAPDERRRFDRRPLSLAIRMKKRVTVTEALKRAAREEPQLQITLVAIPGRGAEPEGDPEGVLDIKRMSVVLYR